MFLDQSCIQKCPAKHSYYINDSYFCNKRKDDEECKSIEKQRVEVSKELTLSHLVCEKCKN